MLKAILYLLISLGATTLGALTGMGGGVIIKPVLDALGDLTAADIGILSSVTVFSMAMISVGKQIRQKATVDLKLAIPIAVGSLLGGNWGDWLLTFIIHAFQYNRFVVTAQNICLAILVIAVFLYMKKGERRPVLAVRGVIPAILTGIFLGTVSSFLGIGGGAINVALIIFVFACDVKTATLCSIITILFAQAPKVASVLLTGNYELHNLPMLPGMVAGAALGGWIGSQLNQKFTEKAVEKAFNSVQVLVFFICLSNIFRNLIS